MTTRIHPSTHHLLLREAQLYELAQLRELLQQQTSAPDPRPSQSAQKLKAFGRG